MRPRNIAQDKALVHTSAAVAQTGLQKHGHDVIETLEQQRHKRCKVLEGAGAVHQESHNRQSRGAAGSKLHRPHVRAEDIHTNIDSCVEYRETHAGIARR